MRSLGEDPMTTAPTTSYYLRRLPADLSRELRLHALRNGSTMRAEIIEAIRRYLAAAAATEQGT